MADYIRQRIEALEAHEKNLLREHKELSEMHCADAARHLMHAIEDVDYRLNIAYGQLRELEARE